MRINYLAAMGRSAVAGPTLVDSYSESNQDSDGLLGASDSLAIAQSFTAIAASLGTCKFFVKKFGSPTGNATAKLYAVTGTFGTTSKPTGAALATSDVFDVATLTTSYALTTFTFSGANQFAMVAATNYCISLEYGGGDISNDVAMGMDGSSATHGGNKSSTVDGSVWIASATVDVCFYVYST